MIIDLQAFITQERAAWSELEGMLDRLEKDPAARLELAEVRRFHYLYQRVSADLARLATFAAERELSRYLEALVARAYVEIHKAHSRPVRLRPLHWALATFPQTFRRHVRAFWLSLTVMMIGSLFGGMALLLDPDAKEVFMPFPHLMQTPAERVAQEEHAKEDRMAGHKTSFSSQLMTHNTRVSIATFALGMGYGVGTIIMLFYNGVILGAVFADFLFAGQARFVFGWLLPHGAIEIPAILLAGQAGLILAGAMIGWGRRLTLRQRLAEVAPDLATLIGGVALMLVWAGIIESFLSQYHEPVIPYSAKILFGSAELVLLVFYLSRMGAGKEGAPDGRKSA